MRRVALAIVLLASAGSSVVRTQPAASQESGADRVAVDPVTCWWRTSATSVRVGEPFTVLLTCSFLQTDAARVIADESRLEPSVVQLPPFEVVGGTRAKDLTTASRRFVQFEYRLRAIAENVFATEVPLPPLEITYRVESRVAGAGSVAGRDLAYALPPLTMRVLSLVPDTAGDIREAPVAAFAEIEAAESRAATFRVAGIVLLVLGALALALAAARLLRSRMARRPTSSRTLSRSAILSGVLRELTAIQDETRASEWTADRAGRALAATRIVAAYASGGNVSQRVTPSGAIPGASGEVMVNGKLGRAAAVSSAVATVDDDELREALARLTAVRYGRNGSIDGRLDETLDAVTRRTNRLLAERPLLEKLWPR